jgi:hypothetical protein
MWHVYASDDSLTTGNRVGLLSRLETGNTNATPVTFDFDAFEVVNPQTVTVSTTVVNSVAKTISAGSAVSLWTPAVYART